ncbi:glycoside hydrolase family 3 protein [Actinoplanes sp. GCM10030250]|uniref:glycoside hydrolase family 3 protein n=1 Tax=Actinoplanes sp. GCM10030250 TaxID=3273376 RepID=UPI00361D8A5E
MRHITVRAAALAVLATLTVLAVVAALLPTEPDEPEASVIYRDARQPVERRVDDLLNRMSLADKIGQMTQAERSAVATDPGLVTRWRLGSVLSGGGSVPKPNTAESWAALVNSLQRAALATPLGIPLIYGADAVHGHGNAYGATVFPHNIGLGASRDPGLVERVYRATGEQMRATGITWNFAPCLCVTRDDRWGRTFESFGEDPALVSSMGTAIDGLSAAGVLATGKHFGGDGDTEYGTGDSGYAIDQGVTVTSRADLDRIDLAPYAAAITEHGLASVMPSYSSIDWTEDGTGDPVKVHASAEMITGRLKGDLGFEGFVISDLEAIHQIPSPGDSAEPTPAQVRLGVNAGVDMFMEPKTAPRFQSVLRSLVETGEVSTARIDDAVRRILRVKFRMGLFEQPYVTAGELGPPGHRALAREAVARSQVLLKNNGVLPLRPGARLYVAGRHADDIGNQAGGWTINWQGRSGDIIPGTTILAGIRSIAPGATVTFSADASAPVSPDDIGVVVVGETPYAEGYGDVGGIVCPWCPASQKEPKSLIPQPGDRAVIDKVCAAAARCVVLLVSGRPQVITSQLGRIDALVASWLPGSEGAGVADVLFGREPFTGRLPLSWPRSITQVPINVGDGQYQPLFPYGWGLRTSGSSPSSSGLFDAAQGRVVAGTAPAGWQKVIAEASLAHESGDDERAAELLHQVTG